MRSTDTNGFNTTFVRHYDELVHWCRGRVNGNQQDPEEFVHLAYLRCRKSWRPGRRSARSSATYLMQALRWVVRDVLREQIRRADRERRAASMRRRSAPAVQLDEIITREAFQMLNARQQQICRALMSGTDIDALCRELQLTRNALAVAVSRVKRRIRHELLESHGQD